MKKILIELVWGKLNPIDSYGKPAYRERIDYSHVKLKTTMPIEGMTYEEWVSGNWIKNIS